MTDAPELSSTSSNLTNQGLEIQETNASLLNMQTLTVTPRTAQGAAPYTPASVAVSHPEVVSSSQEAEVIRRTAAPRLCTIRGS